MSNSIIAINMSKVANRPESFELILYEMGGNLISQASPDSTAVAQKKNRISTDHSRQ
jgi:Ni2+-binding GTPase involved in maturation of urease and hydrogenase